MGTLLLTAKADPWARDSEGLSALHSMIAATPAPDDEVDAEEDACSVAEELPDCLSRVNSESFSFYADAGSYEEQDLDHGLNESRHLRDTGSLRQDMAVSPFGS